MGSIKKIFSFSILLLVATIQSACGANTISAPTETPLPPVATSPTQTTSPPTATTAPEASPTPEFPLGYEQVLVFAGTWEGEWRNTTFGSSGAISFTCTPAIDGTILCSSDIDGMVFGFVNPDPQEFVLLYDQEGMHFEILEDPIFGEISGTILFTGEFTGIADLIPDPGIVSMELSGVLTPESLIGTYQIVFIGGGGAGGEIELHKILN